MNTKKTLLLTQDVTLLGEEEMRAKLAEFLPTKVMEKDFYSYILQFADKKMQVFGFITCYAAMVEAFLSVPSSEDLSPVYQRIVQSSGPSAMVAFLPEGEVIEAAIEMIQYILEGDYPENFKDM